MPIAAAIPAIFGALGTVGGPLAAGAATYGAGKLLGGGGGGEPSTKPKDVAEQSLAKLAGVQAEAGEWGLGQAKELLPEARADIQKALSYYLPLLSGDRQAMMEAMGPEVNQIVSQYDTGRRAAAEFTPRGGGRTTALAELPFRKAGDITNLLQRTRPEAAGKVTDIGQLLASIGLGTMPRGEGGAAASLLSSLTAERGQTMQMWGDIGVGAGKILAQVLLGGGES